MKITDLFNQPLFDKKKENGFWKKIKRVVGKKFNEEKNPQTNRTSRFVAHKSRAGNRPGL